MKNSWQRVWGCVEMRVVRARPLRECQNVHAMAHLGTPCHSLVAPSLLIVYVFTKVARQWQVVTPMEKCLNVSKFLPRHGMHYLTWPASPRIPTTATSSSLLGTPNCVPWRKQFVVSVWGLSKTPHVKATHVKGNRDATMAWMSYWSAAAAATALKWRCCHSRRTTLQSTIRHNWRCEQHLVAVWTALDRMTVIVIEQSTERVPLVSFLDADSIPHARVLVLREYVVVANLPVVSEKQNKTKLY